MAHTLFDRIAAPIFLLRNVAKWHIHYLTELQIIFPSQECSKMAHTLFDRIAAPIFLLRNVTKWHIHYLTELQLLFSSSGM
jgi:Uri superfamily endonuclease